MFNWTTTTLINSIPNNAVVKKNVLRLGKHLFEKRWVESIRKAEGHDFKLCEAELDLAAVKTAINAIAEAKRPTVARLYIYVGLEGSEESIYANDWYRKGMPLSVSFAVAEEAVMAKAIEDTINKFNVFTKVKKVLDVKANAGKLTIKGTHEHQRLQKIAILVGDGEIVGEEKTLLNWELSECRYAASKEGGVAAYEAATGVKLVEAGVNGFGTYSQLLKDLRLPTANHNHWLSVQKDEMPIVGSVYTQYIINYYAPSTANPSFTAVGNRSMSETTHVFWVKSDLVSEWEGILATIDPDAAGLNTVVVNEEKKVYANKKQSLVERVEAIEKA
jgi:hypothetical protein